MSFLKISRHCQGSFAMLMLGPATLGGEVIRHPYSSGREYTSLPVREFGHYVSANTPTLWYLKLHKEPSDNLCSKYVFSTPEPIEVLKGTKIRFISHSGSIPLGPANGDLSRFGIVLVGQQIGSAQPQQWASDLFYIPLTTLSHDMEPRARIVSTPGFTGKCSRPIFSLNGKVVTFIRAKDHSKVLSRSCVFYANLLETCTAIYVDILDAEGKLSSLNPESINWSSDGNSIYFIAPDCGRRKLFKISDIASDGHVRTICLSQEGSVSSVCSYSDSMVDQRLLVSKTTFDDSSQFWVLDGSHGSGKMISSSKEYNHWDLSSAQVSET